MTHLNNRALGNIQSWHGNDEQIAELVRSILRMPDPLPKLYTKRIYAVHAVAGAVIEALGYSHGFKSNIPLENSSRS